MKQEFELTQTNSLKLVALFLAGLAAMFLIAFQGGKLLKAAQHDTLEKVWYIGVLGVGLVALYRGCKAVGAVPTLVTVGPDRLLVLKTQTSEETQVPYAEIASYRAMSFNNRDELRLTLKDGSRCKVAVSSQLYGEQPFAAMVVAFEQAIGTYQPPDGAAQAVVRERTFFEKPISTFVLVALTAFLVFAVWVVLTSDRPARLGGQIGALSAYAAYVAAWLAARERRNAK